MLNYSTLARFNRAASGFQTKELKVMQEHLTALSIRLLGWMIFRCIILLNSLVFIFSTLLVHLDFKNILYLYGVNNTKVSKI